ncbi:uncharacterized protein EI97DRAFT_462720 [Westerdykella ornata]|uniref:Uncharacterized protein n=1 Tax=Westerdykella ornata TaxID=318751 RepID=A0A6A6J5V8_WESOR|nr:uncharacterized protein EI97DRAFT_462720 [Westerdykella ornata]KAF2271604.1 hypothetical protein EI97DRAFT_462720 [Westerdykella ornata]
MNPQLDPHGGAPGQVYSRQTTGQPSTASAAGTRSSSQGFGYSYDQGYGGHQGNPPYGAQEYGSEQTSQRVHHYAQQGHNSMYSMPSAQASVQGPTQYDSVQPYQSRETPLDVLSGGYTPVAQGQYYNVSGQEAPASAPVGGMPAHPPSQYASMGYTPTPPPGAVGRESVTPSYTAAGMTDPHQPASRGPYPEAGFTEQSAHNWDQYYGQFRDAAKQIFTAVKNGQLSEAGRHLLSLTDWLFQVAETLGLHRDDAEQQQQKLKFWEEFNNCWLSTLQKQKDTTEGLKKSGHSMSSPSLISHEFLKRMGDQIVKFSNAFEKHGLVDYQMGIWEEEIIAMIIKCQTILEDSGLAGDLPQRVEAQSSRK